MTSTIQPTSYRAAIADLEEIVQRLRTAEDLDVDELVDDVARARDLIQFCEDKIQRADVQVKSVLDEIQNKPAGALPNALMPETPQFEDEVTSMTRAPDADIPF
jgi:exodeoxyribonuclease VII small subunit